MSWIFLLCYKSVFNYAEKCNVYSLPISYLAIFRTCTLYIGLIGFRNGCVQLSETKQINFFYAFTVIASDVTYIVQMYGKSVMK
jgi:hypothetical protein